MFPRNASCVIMYPKRMEHTHTKKTRDKTEFVELPPSAYGVLWYSNVLCGVLRGALEMVQMRVEARFVKDVLQGDEVSEIR